VIGRNIRSDLRLRLTHERGQQRDCAHGFESREREREREREGEREKERVQSELLIQEMRG
jgi:hypothetical protein